MVHKNFIRLLALLLALAALTAPVSADAGQRLVVEREIFDFLTNENNDIYCLEANTLPGMTPTSLLPQEAAVVGIDFNELCQKIIDLSLKKYSK